MELVGCRMYVYTWLVMFVFLCTTSAQEEHYYDGECEHESFYCDYNDATMFYRCIDGVYYSFQCPAGLHFSSAQQTCDWPHNADCTTEDHSSDYYYDSSSSSSDYDAPPSHAHSSEEDTHNHAHSHTHTHTQNHGGHLGNLKVDTWINSPAASGNTWWRPAGVDPATWQDVSNLKTPDYAVHIPDDPKPDSGSTSTGNSGKKKPSSGTSVARTTSHGTTNRQRSANVESHGGECNPATCQLPDCHCPGFSIPNGIPASSTPQMVMLTFDDEVSSAFYGYYQRLFRPGRYNPNGCPVRGCLFVSGSGTIYDLVFPLYAMGVEIASHSITHRFPHTWWSSASYQEYVNEASGMRDNLVNQAGVPRDDIKGFRVPFLQLGSDNMFGALYDSGFTYDTSMFTGAQWEGSHAPVWPFTLDYVPGPDFCQHGPCPTREYPGMWEIPVQRWYGMDGHSCAMADGCSATGDAEETLEYLKSNFRRYYGSNRAPFGIFVHARWFSSEHNLEGLDRFIDFLLTLDDVYIVTPSQVVDWMRQPTPLSQIRGFGPWGCNGGSNDV